MICEYAQGCPAYQSDSATCNQDNGGQFCSEWRNRKQIDRIIQRATRRAFLLITTGAIISVIAFVYLLLEVLHQ